MLLLIIKYPEYFIIKLFIVLFLSILVFFGNLLWIIEVFYY